MDGPTSRVVGLFQSDVKMGVAKTRQDHWEIGDKLASIFFLKSQWRAVSAKEGRRYLCNVFSHWLKSLSRDMRQKKVVPAVHTKGN